MRASRRQILRPLVVTDPPLALLPVAETLLEVLRAGGLEPGLFTDLRSNPTAPMSRPGWRIPCRQS